MAAGRALGWCVALLTLVAVFPASVLADPAPERLFPAPGEVVSSLPETVEGWFSERLDARPGATVLQVFELGGRRVDLGRPGVDASDPTHVAAGIERTGRSGVYYAVWRVTSAADGTTAQYCSVFLVGDDAVAKARKAGVGLDCRGVGVVGLFDPVLTPADVVQLTPSPTATRTATRTATPTAAATPTGTPEATPTATPVAPSDGDDDGGFPAWALIATGGVVGALMLGVGLLLGVAVTGGGGRRPPRRPMGGPPGRGPEPPYGGGRGDIEPPPPAPRPPREPFGRPPPRPPFG